MEEDNDQITGWDDQQIKILNKKSIKKHKKKTTISSLAEQDYHQRKLKPSYTLPVIKNKHIQDGPIIQTKQKKQDSHMEKFIGAIEDRIAKIGKGIKLKEFLQMNNPDLTIGNQMEVLHSADKQSQNDQTYSIQKKLKQIKHSSTIIKGQKITNLQKLKIQAIQYCSTPKHVSISDKQKNELLKKISKNSMKNLSKKQKGKYFIVKRDKITPQQVSQQVSKIAVQSKKSHDCEQLSSEQKRTKILKQKYKNIIKTIQIQRKNSFTLLNSQSQQLKKVSHLRRNTNGQSKFNNIIRQDQQKKLKINRWKQCNFNDTLITKQDKIQNKRLRKWNKVLKQVQNQAKTLKKLKDKHRHMFKAQMQLSSQQMNELNKNQKNRNLTMMLTKKIKSNYLNEPVNMKDLKQTLLKQMNRLNTKQKHSRTQQQSNGFQEFNDQCLFNKKIELPNIQCDNNC